MKQTKFAKSLALSTGVLVFSGAISYLIFAWEPPSATPPGPPNAHAPINVGPAAQTKAGQLNLSRDNLGECCSAGSDYTLSLAENTITTGKKAGIQFHNSMEAEGQLRLDVGTNGRELKAYSYQTDMDLHATGYVQGDQGLCIGNVCRDTWPNGVIPRDCGEGGWVQGINPDGTIICGSGGTPPMPVNCNEALSSGNKKIFVTSLTYSGTSLTSDSAADALCQTRANAAGHKDASGNNAIFKALVYLGGRDPINLMAGANYYWNGVVSETRCDWKLVANSGSDFFTDKSGSWLRAPITGNESGGAMNVNVWTNIRPTGGGNYSLLNTANINTNPCASSHTVWGQNLGCCYPCCYVSWLYISGIDTLRCYRSQHWYGNSSSANLSWAYNLYASGTDACNTCKSQSRALYCVEQ